VDSRGLEDGGDDGSLSVLLGVESGSEVELEALSEVVLQLNLSSENVGGAPDLRETVKQGRRSARSLVTRSGNVGGKGRKGKVGREGKDGEFYTEKGCRAQISHGGRSRPDRECPWEVHPFRE